MPATPPSFEEKDVPDVAGPRARGAKTPRWWIWLVSIGLLAGAAYFVWTASGDAKPRNGKPELNPADRVVPVVAMPARTADVNVYIGGLGSVTPLHTVTVRSRVDGQLMRVTFREGQLVKQGDLLAEIDPRPFQVQLAQAEGQMVRDQALLRNAKIDLERYQTLLAQDSIAKQTLDTQVALVRQYEGTVKADQSQIDNAQLQLTYSRITAPISGRLGLRLVDPGNIVHASDTNGIVVITQLQPITVIFTIPEDNLPAVMKRLQAGETLPVDAYDRAEKTKLATGTLLTVDNQIDPTTGTVKLKAQFANDDFSLFPNQFVNARMLVDVQRGATVIPAVAVQRGTEGTFVYVVQPDHTATVRPIKLGPTRGETAAVDSGLAPGDLVVVDGSDRLREGAKIELAQKDVPAVQNGTPPRPDGPHQHGAQRTPSAAAK